MDERDWVAFAVFCGDWEADSRLDDGEKQQLLKDRQMDVLLSKWQRDFMPDREKPHSGSCTTMPWTCIRCEMDWWYHIADGILMIRNATAARQRGGEEE